MKYEMKRKEFLFLPQSYEKFKNYLENILFIETKEFLESGFKDILARDIEKFLMIIDPEKDKNQEFANLVNDMDLLKDDLNSRLMSDDVNLRLKNYDVNLMLMNDDLNSLFFTRKLFEDFSEISETTISIIRCVFKKYINEFINREILFADNQSRSTTNPILGYLSTENAKLNESDTMENCIERIYHFYHDFNILIDLFFFSDKRSFVILTDLLKENLNKEVPVKENKMKETEFNLNGDVQVFDFSEKLAKFSHSRIYSPMKIEIKQAKIDKIRFIYQKLNEAYMNRVIEKHENGINSRREYEQIYGNNLPINHTVQHQPMPSNLCRMYDNLSEIYDNCFPDYLFGDQFMSSKVKNNSKLSSIGKNINNKRLVNRIGNRYSENSLYSRSTERDDIIEDLLILIPIKDKFEKEYLKYMSKRLLDYNYVYEKEQEFILKMKNVLSTEFSRKAIKMFKDINFSINFNKRTLNKIKGDDEIRAIYLNSSIFYNGMFIDKDSKTKGCFNNGFETQRRFKNSGYINFYSQRNSHVKNCRDRPKSNEENYLSYSQPMRTQGQHKVATIDRLVDDYTNKFIGTDDINNINNNNCITSESNVDLIFKNPSDEKNKKHAVLYNTPFYISILSQCVWPIELTDSKNLDVPAEIDLFFSKIEHNYRREFPNRTLNWIYELGYVEIVIETDKMYTVRMNIFHYVVLRLFNDHDYLEIDDVLKLSGMKKDDCLCVVESLVYAGFLVNIRKNECEEIQQGGDHDDKNNNPKEINNPKGGNMKNSSNPKKPITSNAQVLTFNSNFTAPFQHINLADLKFDQRKRAQNEKINIELVLSTVIARIMKREKEIPIKKAIRMIEKEINEKHYEIKSCFKMDMSKVQEIFASLCDKGVIELNDDIVFYVP